MKIHRDTSFVQHRPQELLDIPVEQFFTSLRFVNREKLDQLGLEAGAFDLDKAK